MQTILDNAPLLKLVEEDNGRVLHYVNASSPLTVNFVMAFFFLLAIIFLIKKQFKGAMVNGIILAMVYGAIWFTQKKQSRFDLEKRMFYMGEHHVGFDEIIGFQIYKRRECEIRKNGTMRKPECYFVHSVMVLLKSNQKITLVSYRNHAKAAADVKHLSEAVKRPILKTEKARSAP